MKGIYKIVTGLILVIFIGTLSYYIVYPLLPNIVVLKNKVSNFSPYNIGFQISTSFFLKLSEPKYDINQDEETIEYVPADVEVANLEDKDTRLSIPSISVKGNIVDGVSQENMLRGFWHHPLSDEPGKRGNVVVFGHRFDKVPPNPMTFYNLDKVKVGDEVIIYQDNREIKYNVIKIYETEKNDQKIFSNISDYQLTLITCSPLWTSEKRLVVVAVQSWVDSII